MQDVSNDYANTTNANGTFHSRLADSTTTMTMMHQSRSQASKYRFAAPYAPSLTSFRPSSRSSENISPGKISQTQGVSHMLGHQDRFIPRANIVKMNTSSHVPTVLADNCGMKLNRVLEFGSAPPLQRQFAPADFMSQFTQYRPIPKNSEAVVRNISTKPTKILDAPGLVDDFYTNLLDWSVSLNIMAIGLGSTVYAWNPNSSDVSIIAEVDPEGLGAVTVTALKWSTEDSCIAVSTSQGHVQIWDASENALLRTMKGRRDRTAALSWNGHILSSGGRDSSIVNHDVRLKQHKVGELRGHTGEICGLSWRQDGYILASGGNDNLVNLWDARVNSGAMHQLTQHEAAVKALAWCPWHNNLLATGGGSADQQINFWNATTGHRIKSVDTGAQVTSLKWSDVHREIVGTLGYPSNSIAIWSYPNLTKQVEIVNAHETRILTAALSSDQRTLVTCAADENIKFWDLFESSQRSKSNRHGIISNLSLGRI